MALVRALNSAISGLNAQQIKIDTVGDNLANVTTTGFKQTRTLFSTLLSQTLTRGQGPSTSLGGIDPKQIGLGVKLSRQQHIFSQGSLKATGINTDMAIEGDGFFVFKDQNGSLVYTRDGTLSLNSEQELFHNANTGFLIQGFQADFDNFVINEGVLTDLNIPVGNLQIARETDNTQFEGNLNGGGQIADDGTITQSQLLEDVTTGLPATLATLLTDLGRDDPGTGGTIDFGLANGEVINVEFKKDGRTITGTFEVGSPPPIGGTTLGNFIDFLEGLMAVHTGSNAGSEQHGARLRSLVDGSVVGDTVDVGGVVAGAPGSGTEAGTRAVTITEANFDPVAAGVQIGDFVRFESGPAAGTIGVITAVAAGTFTFNHENGNAVPTDGNVYFIHEPAFVRLGNAAAPIPDADQTTRSGDGIIRIAGNVGASSAITDIEITQGTDRLFGFTEAVAARGETTTTRIAIFDSLGTPHVVDYFFALTGKSDAGNTFRYWAESSDNTTNPGVTFTRQIGSGTMLFGIDGQFSTSANTQTTLNLVASGASTPVIYTNDFSRMTGFASDVDGNGNIINRSEVQLFEQDGFEQGTLIDFAVQSNGVVKGIFTNGLTRDLARVVVAFFPNNNGLLDVGDNFFRDGVNSGLAQIGEPGRFGRGEVRGGFLEESNVEMSEQFTDLVVAQRAFQANARTIRVSNDLLQELVNLV